MKLIKLISVLVCVAGTSSAFSEVESNINRDNLIGSWTCKHEFLEPKTKMLIDVKYTTNFINNGNAYGSGDLFFTIEGMPKINYKASDNSTWSLKGDQLTVKSQKINFTNVSHPQLDKFLDINKILPATVNESGKILELSANKLKVKSTLNNVEFTCSK